MPRKKKIEIDMRYISPEPNRNGFVVTMPSLTDRRPKVRFKVLEDAISFRDMALSKINKGQRSENLNMTVFQWLKIYQNEYCDKLAEKTRQNNWSLIKNHCQSLFKLKMVGGIKKYHTTKLINNMLNEGYSTKTIKRTYAVLSAAFNRVKKEEIIIYDEIPLPKCDLSEEHSVRIKPIRDNRPRKAYSVKDLNDLVSAARSYSNNRAFRQRWVCIIKLLRLTGMRISECLGICKKDLEIFDEKILIHLHQGVHDVSKSKNKENKCWTVNKLKCDAAYRPLEINDKELIDLIKVFYYATDRPVYYGGIKFVFLFATRSGNPILHSNFKETFDKIKAKSKTDMRPYEIRHSIATFMARDKDIAFADAAAFLGHTLEVFMKYYVHPDPDKVSAISNKITMSQMNIPVRRSRLSGHKETA